MDILQNILDLVIFLISLSFLVMIHELGHFAAAKVFKVYCMDFSIGFGKAFFHKKRKNGETYFSLRVVPFGGFVAMAEDEGETPDGVKVPKHRSINGIKKWKTIIIMSSGVVMNFLLAILLIYTSVQFFPINNVYRNAYIVQENSPAALAGVQSFNFEDQTQGDVLEMKTYYYAEDGYIYEEEPEEDKITSYESVFAELVTFTKADATSDEYYAVINTSSLTLKDLTFKSSNFVFRQKVEHDGKYKYISGSDIAGNDSEKLKQYTTATFDTKFYRRDEEGNKTVPSDDKPIVLTIEDGKLQDIGLSFYNYQTRASFVEAWETTFKSFGEGTTLIFKTLGGLFTGKGWENVGGIVALYSVTTTTLSDYGFGYYLLYWGIISINLGIVNLLPIPGLDGWHILVTAIEGITRKKIPDKFKTVVTYVGIALLFGLMILLLFKDIFFLMF